MEIIRKKRNAVFIGRSLIILEIMLLWNRFMLFYGFHYYIYLQLYFQNIGII